MKRKNAGNNDSRTDIKNAALEEFTLKGKHGAHMEEIARRAKINKAMVYYYYSSKEKLFWEIVENSFSLIFTNAERAIRKVITTVADEKEALRGIIVAYFEAVVAHSRYIKIIHYALAHEPDKMQDMVRNIRRKNPFDTPVVLMRFLENGMKKGLFKKSNPHQLVLSLISVCLFYFLGKPISMVMLDLDIEDEEKFFMERKRSIEDLLLNGILEKKNDTH